MRQHLTGPNVAKLICLLILILLPFVVPSPYIRHLLIITFIYAIVASNWDLSLGYAGVFNFGHIAFFAVGVYGSAILSKTFGITPWATIPIAGLIGVVAALIISLPVLRLKGIYVVLVTFAFSQLCFQLVLSQEEITGGSMGMPLLPPLKIGDYNFARDGKFGYYFIGLFLLVLSTIYLHRLVHSRFGTSIIALRDNEDYAISRGISLARQRMLTLGLERLLHRRRRGLLLHLRTGRLAGDLRLRLSLPGALDAAAGRPQQHLRPDPRGLCHHAAVGSDGRSRADALPHHLGSDHLDATVLSGRPHQCPAAGAVLDFQGRQRDRAKNEDDR